MVTQEESRKTGETKRTYLTACPRNCYSTCSMEVTIENNHLRSIKVHGENRAVNSSVCLKGLSYVQRQASNDRITYPLLRNQQSGNFERISWDTALTLISEKINYFKGRFGPQSIFYLTGSGTKGLLNSLGAEFWQAVGGYTAAYGDLCWPAGLEATRLTFGSNKHNAPWDLANARLIVVWGKNPAETNVQQMVHINDAIKAGAIYVVVDSRRTPSVENADLFIQPRPGTDGIVALAVAKLLVERGCVDKEFVQTCVASYEEFEAQLVPYTLKRAAEVADVPPEQISLLTDLIGKTKPFTLVAGFGMQRYTNSGQTMRSLMALLVLTGNIGKPGAGWMYANLQTHIFSTVQDPVASFPPSNPDPVVRTAVSVARLGEDMLRLSDPPLKMIWVERGNPVSQAPDISRVMEAFHQLEFRVVVDQFMTDTAREADLILPAKSMFEQTDVLTAYWHPYIQIRQKVLEPPLEVKPESEVYYLLSKRLGLSVDIPEPTDESVEAYLEQKLAPFPSLTLEKLRQGPVLVPDHEEVVWSDLQFDTPSKKIELMPAQVAELWGLTSFPHFAEPQESVVHVPDNERKAWFYFMTPNTKNRIHSQFGNLPWIQELGERPYLDINPVDARKLGLVTDDWVNVSNSRGSIKVKVRLRGGVKMGCVCIPNGWWTSSDVGVNFLSKGRETDMGHGAAFHDNLVKVAKVG